jgi:hypothetical protein
VDKQTVEGKDPECRSVVGMRKEHGNMLGLIFLFAPAMKMEQIVYRNVCILISDLGYHSWERIKHLGHWKFEIKTF